MNPQTLRSMPIRLVTVDLPEPFGPTRTYSSGLFFESDMLPSGGGQGYADLLFLHSELSITIVNSIRVDGLAPSDLSIDERAQLSVDLLDDHESGCRHIQSTIILYDLGSSTGCPRISNRWRCIVSAADGDPDFPVTII